MSEQETNTQQKDAAKPNRKKMLLITTASLATVLALSCTGLGLYRHYQVQSLTADCENATATVAAAQKKLDTLVASDDVITALKVSESQVSDAQTLAKLKEAVEQAARKETVPACSIAYFDLSAHPQTAIVTLGKTITAQSATVKDAVDAVNKSVAQKQLEDAQKKLKTAVDSANKVLADSDGKVSDNVTRDALKAAIDTANKLLKDNKETDPAKYTTKVLDDAIGGVNASVEAKRKADEEAAAQAAAAQAQRSYVPTYNNYTGGGYSGGGYSGGSNSGSGNNVGGYVDLGLGGGEGVGSADDCDAACRAPIVH